MPGSATFRKSRRTHLGGAMERMNISTAHEHNVFWSCHVLPNFAERLRMDWMNISNIPTLYPSWKLSSRRQKVHDGMVKLQQGSSHNGWPTYCHPSNGCYICSLSPPKLHPGPIRWVKRTAKGQDLGFMQCNHAIPIQLDTHHLIRNKGSFRCLFRKSCDE